MKHLTLFMFLVIILSACTSKHEAMLQKMDELDAMGDNYDTFPNDTVALDVVAYMERCGTSEERAKAWKMLAKVYRRKGWYFWEENAFSMAVGCVDTTQAFDTLSFAQTLFDWSHCLARSLDGLQSQEQVRRAVRFALMAGDTIHAMRYYGDIDSDSAYHYLWHKGEKALAMDASMPMIDNLIKIHHCDSAAMMLERYDSAAKMLDKYSKYSSYNLDSPYSYEANHYWMMRGKLHKAEERYDSAIYYYKKVAELDSLHWEEASLAVWEIAECFRRLGMEDSAKCYEWENVKITEFGSYRLMEDRFKSRFRDYQIQHDNLDMRDEAERLHLWMLGGIFMFAFIVFFGVYRYMKLRQEHQDTLQQNHEFVDMLKSLRERVSNPILDTSIAKHFHELSAQDAHPTEEEWKQLCDEVNSQHPNLFPCIAEHYELTPHEQRLISLIAISCTPLQMSILLVCTKSNISNLRRRLYKRIAGTDGSGADLDKLVNNLCQ
ncbi:MAG: hypothetical protein MJZ36_06665 [Bacteroidaceae bacterium]|nr:hypothetical protein [Bacteroidaceae bacterium]